MRTAVTAFVASALVLPFAAFSPLRAQERVATPSMIEIPLMVRADFPDVDEPMLTGLFYRVLQREETGAVLLAATRTTGRIVDCRATWTTVVPREQVLLTIRFEVQEAAERGPQPVDDAAIARHVERQLDALFHAPQAEQLAAQLHSAEGAARAAGEQQAKLAERLAALGFDDLAAARESLSSLQQKRLDVELELRTEQAMQARLQDQAARAQAQRAELQDRAAELEGRREAAERKLGEVGSVPHAQRGKDHEARLVQLEAEIRSIAVELDRVHDATNQARSLYTEAADALTKSTIALQRHQSRAQVLDELIARQQHVVEDASSRARERERIAQELARASAEADAARSRMAELRRRRDALQPVQVTPWR